MRVGDARFPPSRERGELSPGPIWPCLALFTPTVEAGNGATVAPFGTPFTRTRWAQLALVVASFGLVRSGQERQTFNSVAFDCIRLHSLSPARGRDASLDVGRNDVCEQCSNQRGYGVRGSCRWFGVGEPFSPAAALRSLNSYRWGLKSLLSLGEGQGEGCPQVGASHLCPAVVDGSTGRRPTRWVPGG